MDFARVQEALGIDEAQAERLRQIQTEGRKQQIRNQAETQVARMELEELLLAEVVDEKAVVAKANQLAELQKAALRARVDHQLAMREILTADQARKLKAFRGRARGQRGQGRQMRRPGRRGPAGWGSGGQTPPAPDGSTDG
jgi:Spy/CpxP family protein refolding chaperone